MKDYLERISKTLESELDPSFARRARIIFENLDLSGEEKILEIGCGRGFYLKTLIDVLPGLDITGVDLNEKYLQVARKFINNQEVKLIKADATKLPFKDKSFERIIATEILEHIPDDKKAISEMYRVLKPGGMAMLTVPNRDYPFLWDPLNWILERVFHRHIPSNIWWLAGIWADHERLYGEDELREKMEKKRFRIERVWYSTHYCFPFAHFLFYGIGKNVVEKGFLKSFNRFRETEKRSLLSKTIPWPIRKIDSFNDGKNRDISCVNLLFKVRKPKIFSDFF